MASKKQLEFRQFRRDRKAEVEGILTKIFEKAFKEGKYEITWGEEDALLAQRFHEKLQNFRAKIKRRPLENFKLLEVIDQLSISKTALTVTIRRLEKKENPVYAALYVMAERDPDLQDKSLDIFSASIGKIT